MELLYRHFSFFSKYSNHTGYQLKGIYVLGGISQEKKLHSLPWDLAFVLALRRFYGSMVSGLDGNVAQTKISLTPSTLVLYFALLISDVSRSKGYSMMSLCWSFFLRFSTRRRLTPKSE